MEEAGVEGRARDAGRGSGWTEKQRSKRREKCKVEARRPCGPTDKASDYESGDSRFESWQGRTFLSFF